MQETVQASDEHPGPDFWAEIERRTLSPAFVQMVDPARESTFEYRSDIGTTVETAPDGKQFIVAFEDGHLSRTPFAPRRFWSPAVLRGAGWAAGFGALLFFIPLLHLLAPPSFFAETNYWLHDLIVSLSALWLGSSLHRVVDGLRDRRQKNRLR